MDDRAAQCRRMLEVAVQEAPAAYSHHSHLLDVWRHWSSWRWWLYANVDLVEKKAVDGVTALLIAGMITQ
jgi:hypothetical protein